MKRARKEGSKGVATRYKNGASKTAIKKKGKNDEGEQVKYYRKLGIGPHHRVEVGIGGSNLAKKCVIIGSSVLS